mgnify:CR=1 FL=1
MHLWKGIQNMLQEITKENLSDIRNPVFREYAGLYLDIYDSFLEQVELQGVPFHKNTKNLGEKEQLLLKLRALPDISVRCEESSIVYGNLSPACEKCKQGIGSVTCHISFCCHRNCFFCFNPNQDNYKAGLVPNDEWRKELEGIKQAGGELEHIALTGGEPLLHPEDAVSFFQYARALFPQSYLRLYTSGDLLTEELAIRLRDAGLQEIRFSFKMEDPEPLQENVLANMLLAKAYIPRVMVEMPVMPDMEEQMIRLLLRLDTMGIWGINLLELCFPYHNAASFRARGFELKYPPYRTLYNFWYAGGLPVDGSELLALKLLCFAAENKFSPGVHYCSLENKNFGQIYQQNTLLGKPHPTFLFSPKDYYLKTVKAFGEEALTVKKLFDRRGLTRYLYDAKAGYIQFHPELSGQLCGRSLELAVSVNVMEPRNHEVITRELKLLRALPDDCEPAFL